MYSMKRLTLYTAIMLCYSTALSNALNAPRNLQATPISSTQIRLNWRDKSGNEAGFDIERSLDGTHFSLIAKTPANATSYSDSGLMAARKDRLQDSRLQLYRGIAMERGFGNNALGQLHTRPTGRQIWISLPKLHRGRGCDDCAGVRSEV